MKAVVRCTEDQKAEILQKQTSSSIDFDFIGTSSDDFNNAEGEIFFDLMIDGLQPAIIKKNHPVFVNAVIPTCKDLPENCIRINAWNGFLKRDIVEIATPSQQEYASKMMGSLGWKCQIVSDEPGMVAPRIIAMVINEAYFGLEDKISTKEEIDTAMKLGTNYPYGPFEWAEKIGIVKIYSLLNQLSKTDKRYAPSQLLVDEANNIVASKF